MDTAGFGAIEQTVSVVPKRSLDSLGGKDATNELAIHARVVMAVDNLFESFNRNN